MMKVVHVTSKYYPNIGGVENLVKEMCERLSSKEFEVSVFCLDLEATRVPCQKINNVLVKRYHPLAGDPAYVPTLSFLRDLRNEDSSIVHVHNLQNLFPLFFSLIKRSSQCFILQPHYHKYGQTALREALLTSYGFFVPHLILRRAHAIICNSSYEKDLLQKNFSFNGNLVVIPQGLPLDELRSVKSRPAYPNRILFIGSLKKYKGVDTLLHAFKLILHHEKDWNLVLVGDGPERSNLFRLAGKLEISNNIIWKQNLSRIELLSEYSKARVFVSLSYLESFGRAVFEAIAIGIPTVVLGKGVFSEIVNGGLAEGIFSMNPDCIAKAILSAGNSQFRPISPIDHYFQDMENYINRVAEIYREVKGKC